MPYGQAGTGGGQIRANAPHSATRSVPRGPVCQDRASSSCLGLDGPRAVDHLAPTLNRRRELRGPVRYDDAGPDTRAASARQVPNVGPARLPTLREAGPVKVGDESVRISAVVQGSIQRRGVALVRVLGLADHDVPLPLGVVDGSSRASRRLAQPSSTPGMRCPTVGELDPKGDTASWLVQGSSHFLFEQIRAHTGDTETSVEFSCSRRCCRNPHTRSRTQPDASSCRTSCTAASRRRGR